MEGAYQYEADNREPGIGNRQLVPFPYLRKRLGYLKTVKSAPGNREQGTGIISI